MGVLEQLCVRARHGGGLSLLGPILYRLDDLRQDVPIPAALESGRCGASPEILAYVTSNAGDTDQAPDLSIRKAMFLT